MCIILQPLVGSRTAGGIHPGKFEEHIVEDGVGLRTFRSGADTLAVVALCQSLEITVHGRFQTTVQSASSTEVVEHTVDVGTVVVVGCSPLGRIVRIDIVRKEVETDEAVTITAHRTERTTLRYALPVLNHPLGLLVYIILTLVFLTDSIVVVVKLHHNVGVASFI